MPVRKLPSGTGQRKAGFGIVDMPNDRRHGRNGNGKIGLVSSVARYLTRLLGVAATPRNTAAWFANPLQVERVRELIATEDVWCITVPDVGAFALANGAVVHNCDAFRYLSLAWQQIPVKDERPKPTLQPGQVYLPGPPPPRSGRRIAV
jgi:hypothetical protein